MSKYEQDEAVQILRRTVNELSPPARQALQKAREKEAAELFKEAKALLTANGFVVTQEGELTKAKVPDGGQVFLRCDADVIRVLSFSRFKQETMGRHVVELDFDPSSGAFHGREEDRRRVPVPGEPVAPFRSALAVLADVVDKCMREGEKRETKP